MTGRPVVLRAAEVLFTAVVITGLSASAGTPVSLADDGSAEPIPGYRQFLVLIYVDLDNDAATVNCSVWIKGGAAEPGIGITLSCRPPATIAGVFFIGHRNCLLANTGH